MNTTNNETHETVAGGNNPIMRSVNILVTEEISQKLLPKSRSAAVREIAEVIINAYFSGEEWVISAVKEHADASSPKKRREDEKNGIYWEKAIVWIPEAMKREIETICAPNQLRPSEFLRGAVVYATRGKS
jgi:hypothetical protein